MSDPQSAPAWGIQMSKLWMMSGQSFPVDVTAIATEVSKQRSPDPIGLVRPHGMAGIDGMLSRRRSKNDWCISYDENVISPGRINFTLAHEFGHYLMHRSLRDQFSCGQRDVVGFGEAEGRRIESEANVFASYLLMPANDFRAVIGTSRVSLETLRAGADRYRTSLTATALKFVELTEEAVLLVVARDGFICWSVPSRLARLARSYLAPGTPLPHEAHDVGANGRRVAPGVWHRAYEAEEFAITSDSYDLSIFLVHLLNVRHVIDEEEETQDAFDLMTERSSGRGD